MFAEIALPIAQGTFTYELPSALAPRVECGCVVAVTFGVRRRMGGVVTEIHDRRPNYPNIKPIEEVLFEGAVIPSATLRLWQWIADYYMCTLGEVVCAALPSLIKPAGLTPDEFAGSLFRPRTVDFVRAHDAVELPRRAHAARAAMEIIASQPTPLRRSALRGMGISDAIVRKLREAGAIEIYSEVDTSTPTLADFDTPTLTDAQSAALASLQEGLRTTDTALLQGVAGSGKTEIVMTLAARALSKGRSVLWLVPEMSLSKHFAERLKRTFGESVVLYHSGLTPRRRAEIVWSMASQHTPRLVVGVRSSVLLPIADLGLIVVDEEYDSSYKQSDIAPRYSARDCAVMLAPMHGARTILSASTPSMESYANALGGKYTHVILDERYGGSTPPEVVVSDVRKSAERGERRLFLNLELRTAIDKALQSGGQSLLFQERRGTATYVECGCGWVPRCPKCNITLAQHGDRLVCHYCGRSFAMPACPRCGSTELKPMGVGTAQIQQNLRELYPTAVIDRLDRDTAASAPRLRQTLRDMEDGTTDILVGTRLITKGFDFERLTVTGVLNADNLLSGADFRASERALQMLMQAAGRAGRRAVRGTVVIQTSEPQNPIIVHAAEGDFCGAAEAILAERRDFGYPPFNRLIQIEVRAEERELAVNSATQLADAIRTLNVEVLGPQPQYQEGYGRGHTHIIMVKIERGANLAQIKGRILDAATKLRAKNRALTIAFNVDPQ